MKFKTFKLTELKNGQVKVLSTGSYLEMQNLKKTLFSKLRGALIIEEVKE